MIFQKLNPLDANPEKLELRPFQVQDLAFYIANPRGANLSDPGAQKTPSACVYSQYLWEYGGEGSVWVMPKSLLKKNYNEFLRFTDFKPEDLMIVDGTKKQRETQLAYPAKVFLMGFNRFSDDWKTLKTLHPYLSAVIVDEIHMGYSGHESARTQKFYAAMKKFTRFLPLTGTLIDGKLDSAYPTIHVIEPRYYASHYSFLMEHGVYDMDGNIGSWTNHAKLGRIFLRHSVRHSFEEVHGKEGKLIDHRWCDMSPKQATAYKEFEETALLELEKEFLDGSLPGVHSIRCRQLMYHPETFGVAKGETTGKDEMLFVDLADHRNSGQPLIIYASLIPEQKRIVEHCKTYGLRVGMINGEVSSVKRAQIDQDFQAGKLDVVVGSPATSAIGFNWGHVNHIIFSSLDYKNSNFIQAYRRAIRGPRKTPLRISLYRYRNSRVEDRIMSIVDEKSRDAHLVDPSYESLNLSKPEFAPTSPAPKKEKGNYSLRDF